MSLEREPLYAGVFVFIPIAIFNNSACVARHGYGHEGRRERGHGRVHNIIHSVQRQVSRAMKQKLNRNKSSTWATAQTHPADSLLHLIEITPILLACLSNPSYPSNYRATRALKEQKYRKRGKKGTPAQQVQVLHEQMLAPLSSRLQLTQSPPHPRTLTEVT